MAVQAAPSLQNIASATSELWPHMSAVLQRPWRTLTRPSKSSSTRQAQNPTRSPSEPAPAVETHAPFRVPLPEPLAAVPSSAQGFRPHPDAIMANHSVIGTISSVPRNALRLCNPTARSMPLKAMMARQYCTLSRIGPIGNLRPIPRTMNTGLSMLQQRSIFDRAAHKILGSMELTANNNAQSPTAQNAFYNALLRAGFPEIVVERYQSGRFATSPACDALYIRALERIGQTEKAASIQSSKESSGNISQEQMQAIGQAVGARFHGGNAAVARGGTGDKSSPLYVVVDESTKSSIFRWFKFLVYFAFFGYVSMVAITLLIEGTGVLKKVGGSTNAQVRPELQNQRFSDVHGCEEAKEELQDIVEFLKNPERFSNLGGRLPKGVLLVGPPGTGKTLLARAIAGETGVPFYYMSGSEFDEVYVGVGAKRVRELFGAAKAKAPAIVFIDELDAVGGKRSSREAAYHSQTLNQLLTELDGFDQTSGVIFIAATNFPDLLDKALVRPGRFDRRVEVPLPDVRGRIAILKHHMKKMKFEPDVDVSAIAQTTSGFSGADLENLVNSAAINASKHKSPRITVWDLDWAKDKIMMGAEKRSRVMKDKDKLATAYHEGGHTLVAIYTQGGPDLYKATILPRGGTLGTTHFLPEMDAVSTTKKEMLGRLDTAMGGKCAEILIYGDDNVTTGASGDIQQATETAYHMVIDAGMSDKLGNVNLRDNYSGLSSDTKKIVESEVRRLIEEARDRAKTILTERRIELDRLAKALVEYETLDKEEILKVIKGESLDKVKSKSRGMIKMPEVQLPGVITPPNPIPGSSPPGEPDPNVPGRGEPSANT